MAFDWEKYKEEIERLYLTERLTLLKMKKRLARQHANFNPSISSYRTKLREWGYLRKNDRLRGSPRTPGKDAHDSREGGQSSEEEDTELDDYALSPNPDRSPVSPSLGPWKPMNVSSGSDHLLHPMTPQMRSNHCHTQSVSSSTLGVETSPESFFSSAPVSSDPSPSTARTSPALTVSPSTFEQSPMQRTVSMANIGIGQMTRQVVSLPHHDFNVKALDQAVDEDGNTLLHQAAKDAPSWPFLALMMRKTGNITVVNKQGETFFHVLDASRMQDIGDAESFLNLCDELGYNFAQASAVTGITALEASYQKWPNYIISLQSKERGFTQFILHPKNTTGNLQTDNDLPSSSLHYPEVDFELFGSNNFLMNDWKP